MNVQAVYVLGFCFSEDESLVVLMLKARPEWQLGHLNGVGDHVEDGEEPCAAMEREWDEKVGSISPQWRLFACLSGDGWTVHCFRACASLDADMESSSEGEELVLCSPDSLPPNIVPNLSWLIPMAKMRNARDWPFLLRERGQP